MKYLKLFEEYSDNSYTELIKNPKFIKWFGDSVMIDSNDEPIVFYHGSKNNFDIFDKNKIGETDAGWLGSGFYFYDNEEDASQYGNVKKYLLKIENPYYATDEDNEYLSNKNNHQISSEFTENLINEGYDGVYYNGNLRGETVVFDTEQILNID